MFPVDPLSGIRVSQLCYKSPMKLTNKLCETVKQKLVSKQHKFLNFAKQSLFINTSKQQHINIASTVDPTDKK